MDSVSQKCPSATLHPLNSLPVGREPFRKYDGCKMEAFWSHVMPVTLSIKNAPDDIVRRLKERTKKHHRFRESCSQSSRKRSARGP
jgi:hypothetical protein